MQSKAVPEKNGPVPEDNSELGGLTMEEFCRIFPEEFDRGFDTWTSCFDFEGRLEDKENNTNQRLARLQYKTRQPRLATEADVKTDTKASKRTGGAAAEDEKNGGISSARAEDGPTSLTSFGMIAEPPALPISRDDALVDKGTEAPKPCLSPVRTPTAGAASTAMKTIFPLPRLWSFCPTKDMNFITTASIQTYATYSSFW